MDTWIILLTIPVILLIFGYFWLGFKLKNEMKRYVKEFGKDFKVFTYPISLMSVGEFAFCQTNPMNSKDFLKHTKEVVSDYDIAISNIGTKVQLLLINPKLHQAFFELEQDEHYGKVEVIIRALKRVVSDGLGFSEGEATKMKRRVISKMLNFHYIKSLVPKMEAIAKDSARVVFPETMNHCSEHQVL